jgi:hypothetical protein
VDGEKLKEIALSLANIYREFSERVHGKYSFLQAVYRTSENREDNVLKTFSGLLSDAIRSIADLAVIRLNRADLLRKKYLVLVNCDDKSRSSAIFN